MSIPVSVEFNLKFSPIVCPKVECMYYRTPIVILALLQSLDEYDDVKWTYCEQTARMKCPECSSVMLDFKG